MAARRKTRTPARRRTTKPMLNVLKTAETVVLANAATKALFGTDVASFALDGWARPQGAGSNNSWELSAAELVSGLTGGSFGFGEKYLGMVGEQPVMAAIKKNLSDNGGQALATMLLAPIGFKVARKVLARPLINPANRMLKAAGASSIIRI